MDPRTNPYSPGAGVRPVELVGRDSEIEAFEILRSRAVARRPAQSLVFYGLRGVGKTVLLNGLYVQALDCDWIVAKIEADLGSDRTPFRNQVAGALNQSLRQTQTRGIPGRFVKRVLQTFSSFSLTASPDGSFSVGIDIDAAHGRADTGSIVADLSDLAIDLAQAAREIGVGAALFIDEMQHLSVEELGAICQASHEASQRNLPFYIIGTGLPNLPGLLAEAKSYSERLFNYTKIDRLNEADSLTALLSPAKDEGVEWGAEATQIVLGSAGGYPYFLSSSAKQHGTKQRARRSMRSLLFRGFGSVGIDLDAGFFRARWERATPAQRNYLSSMSADGDGPSSTGEIAARLGKKQTSLGPIRAGLIFKGLVYAPEHGLVAFTVPGMANFISRQALS